MQSPRYDMSKWKEQITLISALLLDFHNRHVSEILMGHEQIIFILKLTLKLLGWYMTCVCIWVERLSNMEFCCNVAKEKKRMRLLVYFFWLFWLIFLTSSRSICKQMLLGFERSYFYTALMNCAWSGIIVSRVLELKTWKCELWQAVELNYGHLESLRLDCGCWGQSWNHTLMCPKQSLVNAVCLFGSCVKI